jgi:hypothetical protein
MVLFSRTLRRAHKLPCSNYNETRELEFQFEMKGQSLTEEDYVYATSWVRYGRAFFSGHELRHKTPRFLHRLDVLI